MLFECAIKLTHLALEYLENGYCCASSQIIVLMLLIMRSSLHDGHVLHFDRHMSIWSYEVQKYGPKRVMGILYRHHIIRVPIKAAVVVDCHIDPLTHGRVHTYRNNSNTSYYSRPTYIYIS